MARAKTTDRAEARRRYRAQLAHAEDESMGIVPSNVLSGGQPSATAVASGRATSGTGGAATAATPAPGRPSLLGSLRTAAAPASIMGDLRAFPTIAVRTKAVWLPTLLIVVTGVAFLVPPVAENAIVRFLGVALLAPPPMIPAFLAGMLTSRASWLAGGVAGLVSGLTVAVLVSVSPGTASSTQGLDIQNLGFLLVFGPGFGIAVGAFSGFYRRFLALSQPQRQRPRKPAQGPRNAGARRR